MPTKFEDHVHFDYSVIVEINPVTLTQVFGISNLSYPNYGKM